MKKLLILVLAAAMGFSAVGQDRTREFNSRKLIERVKTLSSDKFEGRGPGTVGGKLAAQYIADQMRSVGVKPGNGTSYFQNVSMIGVKADPNTVLKASKRGAAGVDLKFGDDFVVTTSAQKEQVGVNAELVFAGYGIDAPLYNWNDYKGNPDQYKGKILVILVNDPPATTSEPDLFGGRALTYYGRWTYKYEEAARRGAAGVILIHTPESAGYGWNVVRTSNGSWRYEIARTDGDNSPFLPIKSWMTNEAAERLFTWAGHDLAALKREAQSRGFKPKALGATAAFNLKSEFKRFESPNVVGMVEGSDPVLKDEFMIYTGHWDHLGIGEANSSGDRIYNGAYDNASGVATIIGIAEVLAKTPVKRRPKRSFLFLFPTAEEQGLLGAEYYAQNPLVPLEKTAANVNIDGVNFFGKVADFMPLGADRSSLIDPINEVARERNLRVKSDARPEQGFFFRSDHFPFAKAGVPAVSLQHGDSFIAPLNRDAEAFFKDYTAKYYHQATDEYRPWWDASAMVQEAELGLAIGIKIANLPAMPRYKDSDEFSAPDKKRFRR